MKISNLLSKNLIFLEDEFSTKEEIFKRVSEKLFEYGDIEDVEVFEKALKDREKEGTTLVDEGMAIPHGKSESVKNPRVVLIRSKKGIEWSDNEGANIIILLAIPKRSQGDYHVNLLTKLVGILDEDEFIDGFKSAKTKDEVVKLITSFEGEKKEEEVEDKSKKLVVGVTACPAGIAHTYMAAKALVKAGKELGVEIKIEKQGANGIEDELTKEDLERAHGAIFAVGVEVKNKERFKGMSVVEVEVAEPLRRGKELVEEVLSMEKGSFQGEVGTSKKGESHFSKGKRALLNGISHIVPLIVAGGTILAIAVLCKELLGLQDLYGKEGSWLWLYRKLSGGLLGTLMVPILSGYISMSLADKPGLAPGFAAGFASNLIGGGFLGGMAGGFIAGYTMIAIKKYVKGPETLNGFFTFYLYPVLGTLISGSIMLFLLGKPVAGLNTGLTNYLNNISGGNAMVLGAIIGAMVSFDLGGPVNKAAYAFCTGAIANGNFMPYAVFASTKMVSAFTTTLATKIRPSLYSEEERQCGNSTWILGLAGITEGSIPLMIEDPFRVIPSYVIGSIVTGGIVAFYGIGLQVPGAGIISMVVLEPGAQSKLVEGCIWLGAALIGTVISTIILTALRARKSNRKK